MHVDGDSSWEDSQGSTDRRSVDEGFAWVVFSVRCCLRLVSVRGFSDKASALGFRWTVSQLLFLFLGPVPTLSYPENSLLTSDHPTAQPPKARDSPYLHNHQPRGSWPISLHLDTKQPNFNKTKIPLRRSLTSTKLDRELRMELCFSIHTTLINKEILRASNITLLPTSINLILK